MRSDLMKVADISGWNSQIIKPESQLITEIVGEVLRKLNLVSSSYSTNLVGIFPHIKKVESLLCLDTQDVCVVGIWGMGGVGKTTIAKAVYDHLRYERFDAFHLILNIHDELKRQSVNSLRDKLLSKILEKDSLSMGYQSLKPDFIRRQLGHKKVLIVFDDVNDPKHLKELLGGESYSFGNGSKILVTSRNKQVLKSVTDKMHAVEIMNKKDAMILFSLNAFKQSYPTRSYKELSVRVVKYARGNPLALVVLGSALFDRSKEEWVSALKGLEEKPNSDIQNVLRISYDILSREEKKIFLDIACLFCGSHPDSIIEYYDESELFKIKNLQDKSLLTISSSNTIEMHDLLRDMGRSIDREEHPDKPEKRERLWTPEDVHIVLTKKTGTTNIKAISLDMFKIRKLHLGGDAFGGMSFLQSLQFYNSYELEKNKVYFKGRGRITHLPGRLRYFQWDGFPAKHLPSNFIVQNLVELRLDDSKIKKLWTGVQDLKNLKVISLRNCKDLIKIADLSEAKNLRRIDLWGCKCCLNVPSVYVSEALECIDLSGCLNVRSFPNISSKSTLKYLYLSGTKIKDVPSSIESLSGLKRLELNDCRRLSTISTNICKLKSLVLLSFKGCVKLESFPEILEPMENLKSILLDGCKNLKSFPENWYNMTSLVGLSLKGCKKLKNLPNVLYNMTSLEDLKLDETRVTELPSSTVIEALSLLRCHSLKISSVVTAIPSFSSLKRLYLSGNNCESLPGNMDQLSNLESLFVSDCKRLCSIPKMPSSLQWLEVSDCQSLECIRMEDVVRKSKLSVLRFINCLNLEEVTCRQVVTHSRFMMMQNRCYECVLPGTEIPTELTGMRVRNGSCVTIQFPSSQDWSEFRRLAVCLICSPRSKYKIPKFQCVLKENDHVRATCLFDPDISPDISPIKSEHLFMSNLGPVYCKLDALMGKEVSFEFSDLHMSMVVKKCGVQLLFENTPPVLPTTTTSLMISSTTNTEQDQSPPIIPAPAEQEATDLPPVEAAAVEEDGEDEGTAGAEDENGASSNLRDEVHALNSRFDAFQERWDRIEARQDEIFNFLKAHFPPPQ